VDIVITGRRVDVPERFRRVAQEKLAKVAQFTPSAQRIDVELSHERNPRQSSQCERVEITVRDKGPVIRAEACSEDSLAALDLAFGKLLERLRRMGDRRKVHHGRHAPASVRGSSMLTAAELGDFAEVAAGGAVATAERNPLNGDLADHLRDDRLDDYLYDGHPNGHTPSAHPHPGHLPEARLDGGHTHTASPGSAVIAGDPAFDEFADVTENRDLPAGCEDLADSPVVIRTKDHEAAPMTIDQALYEMELVGHDFYLFVDAACGKPSVVYRRRGWNYGVIRLAVQPELVGAGGLA
jgi:ribosomal subunit interface protein